MQLSFVQARWNAGAAAMVAAALLLAPPHAGAQEGGNNTAKPPRPKVFHDGTFAVKPVHYQIFYYLQGNKMHSDEDAHVYYEPAFLVSAVSNTENQCSQVNRVDVFMSQLKGGSTEPTSSKICLDIPESATVKHYYDEANESLTLFFRMVAQPKKIEAALREELLTVAKLENSDESRLVYGSDPYRIGPLPTDKLIFSFAKKYRREDGALSQVSSENVNGVVGQPSEFSVHFNGLSKSLANKIVDDLNNNRTDVLYFYTFGGVSDESCFVTFENILDQDINSIKKLKGEGGEGKIARHHVADIAEQAVKSELYSSRCSDPLNGQALLNSLMAKVGQAGIFEIKEWKELNEVIDYDRDEFKADISTSLDTEENETVKNIVESMLTDAASESSTRDRSGGIEGPDIPFLGNIKANASWSGADSEARSKAQQHFTDTLSKKGITVDFDGKKFVPKSVDVYSTAELQKLFGSTVTIDFIVTRSAEGRGDKRLTRQDWFVGVE